MTPTLHALGDSGITITLSENSDRVSTKAARDAAASIRGAAIPHVDEIIAAYTTVTLFYDSLHASHAEIAKQALAAIAAAAIDAAAAKSRHHLICVVYDGADLDEVAAATGMAREQVIEIHSSATYTVDLLGFVPGFAYLSELDARLELPRRAQPRQRVPAGSVAIASRLTGIYPFDTPGGWHILGSTTEVMFDPRRERSSLFEPGDTVKFEAVR